MPVMHDMDEETKAKYKADKLEEIREYHAELIKDLGITKFDLNMKSQFKNDRGQTVVGIFPSEFKKPIGFFFELINSDLLPIDPNRTVYRIPPNPTHSEEFELHPKGFYMVPMDEIREVNKNSVAITGPTAVTASDEIFRPTAKAQETLKVKQQEAEVKKDSVKSENVIISRRDYFAGMALQGILASNPRLWESIASTYAADKSVKFADALISELNK